MYKKISITCIVVFLLSFTITNNFSELVQEKLLNYVENPPEKIYVQTDKPYYTLGEDIWYTTYLVNGIDHKKTNKSKVVYVELINDQDSIVSKKQLYISNTNTAGDFKIKNNWKAGNYILRAYTNYMRNQDAAYFFQKQIPIWDTEKTEEISTVDASSSNSEKQKLILKEKPNLEFYPEGGYLINGLTSKVGIKVKDTFNRDISISGTIKDSDNKTISSFKTFHSGLGLISITPEINKTYYASVIVNNVEYTYKLPKVLSIGYNLNIVNNGSHLVVKASTNSPLGLKNSYLLAHQRGALVFEKFETEDSNSYLIRFNTDTLNDGVTHFTLFDNEGKPVCERLVFIDNPENSISVNLDSDNLTPARRDKINLNIDLKDTNGNPVVGDLSMSITDIDAIGHSSKDDNIKTYLLLNSDLRGQIKNPGYFFEKENDPKRRYLLDLVMLTHGWRRFTWNELLYKPKANQFTPETGIYISGVTASKKSKQNIPAVTKLTFMGSFPYQEKIRSNTNGIFKYGPFVFMDTIPTLIEARVNEFKKEETKANRMVDIRLTANHNSSPKVFKQNILRSSLNDETKISNFLALSQNISMINEAFLEEARLLDEVVITATKKSEKEKRNEELNEKAFYGFPTNRIDLKGNPEMEVYNIFDLLNMLPGVTANNNSISIRNGGVPRIYLNNFPVELDDITNMTAVDVDFIDVLKGADASFFPNSANGVIVIHQKLGANVLAKNIKRKPGIIDFTSTGFYTAREFYSPNHISMPNEATKQDIRTTLHWEPKITLTNASKKANVSFFTSDTKSRYAIKIEGITDNGIPVYHFSTFEVE